MRLLAACLILGCGALLAAEQPRPEILVQTRVIEIDVDELRKFDAHLLGRLRDGDPSAAIPLVRDRTPLRVRPLATPNMRLPLGKQAQHFSGGETRTFPPKEFGTSLQVAVEEASEAPGSIETHVDISITARTARGEEIVDDARYSLQFVAAPGESRLHVGDVITSESGTRQQFVLISIEQTHFGGDR